MFETDGDVGRVDEREHPPPSKHRVSMWELVDQILSFERVRD